MERRNQIEPDASHRDCDSFADVARIVQQAAEVNDRRWKALAARFPGQVPVTPVQLIDFFAHEYGWTLDHIAGLDDLQTYAFVEAALRRRESGAGDAVSDKPKKKAPRDKETESRDKWLYNQCKKRKKTYKAIMLELQRIAQKRGWLTLSSPQAVLQAAQRFVKRHELENLPHRRES
jgi:hypothetical protein